MNPLEIWVPATAALIGALVGGAVAYLTNRQQIKHATVEAKRTRELSLKRDVYLDAADGMARGFELLAGFSRVELTTQQISEVYKGNSGWGCKVHIVGELETIIAFNSASEFLLSRSLNLIEDRAKLDTIRGRCESTVQQIEALRSQSQQLIQALQFVSTSESVPQARAMAPQIATNLLAFQERLSETQRALSSLNMQKNALHKRLLVTSMEAVMEYQEYLAEVTIHVRRELQFSLDNDAYKKDVESLSSRVLRQLREMIDRLDTEIQKG